MKKVYSLLCLAVLLIINTALAPVEHGVHVALLKNKKIVIQIVPDKTYENVVAYINFYSKDNKRVAQKAYSLSNGNDKHVRKDVVTNRTFKFSFDEDVTRVTIDHVNEGEELDKEGGAKGKKLNLPISKTALGPVED
ncbi:MAG TPA: hypothetical protein VK589_10840 [Chryseolinea sp.]|nr:hypothetical protein [Chryseolinea sp.]